MKRLRALFTRNARHAPDEILAEQTLCQTQDRVSPVLAGLEDETEDGDRDGSAVDLENDDGSKDRIGPAASCLDSGTEDGDRDGSAVELENKAGGKERVCPTPAGTEGEAAGEDRDDPALEGLKKEAGSKDQVDSAHACLKEANVRVKMDLADKTRRESRGIWLGQRVPTAHEKIVAAVWKQVAIENRAASRRISGCKDAYDSRGSAFT